VGTLRNEKKLSVEQAVICKNASDHGAERLAMITAASSDAVFDSRANEA